MKKTFFHTLLCVAAAASLLGTASCSILNKNKNTASTEVNQTGAESENVVNTPVNRDNPNDKVSTMPIKKEIIKMDTMMFMRVNGIWTLREIGGTTLSAAKGDDDENRPYINFDGRTGKFYANDGCNTINGEFRITQDGKLTINSLLSTLMMCPDAKYATEFKQGLANTVSCKFDEEVDENILILCDAKGNVLMKLARPETDFLNGSWTVKTIDGKAINNDAVRMVIDIPEMKIHGNTGCNVFNGSIFVDPDKNGSIQFKDVAVTRMMCPDIATETAFLVALEAVEYARLVNGEAQLLNSSHKAVMTLSPLPLEK